LHVHGERHADAITDVFLEPGRSGEALGRMDDLREAVAARVEPRPDLAARSHILGHGDDARNFCVASRWKRAANQPYCLREPPAGLAQPRLQHFAGVDRGAAAGEALAEAATDR